MKPAPTLRGRCLPPSGVGGAAQRLLGADVLPYVAHRRGVAVAQQVHLPELVGVNAHLAGDEVGVRFHGEHHLRLGRTSHVALGDVVGIDHVAVNAGVGDAVDAAQVVCPPQIHRRLEGSVTPAVEHHPRLSRHQSPVALHAAADGHGRRMPGVGGHQFLDVVHHHLDRTPGVQRQVVAQRHVHERTLAAEVAADAARVQHDAFLVHPPHGGQLLAQGIGVLVVDPYFNPPCIPPFKGGRGGRLGADHAGMGFDVSLVHQLGIEGVLEHQVCLCEPPLHVALPPGYVGEHVVDVRLRLRQPLVAGHIRVQRWGVLFHRLVGVEDGRQLLVLHVNEQQCFLDGFLRLGGHCRHLLPDEAHHVAGQHRHIPQAAAHQRVGQVGGGYNRTDTRHGLRLLCVNADDAGVREGRTQRLAPQHPRQCDVGGVNRLPGNLVRPLAADDRLADGACDGGHISPGCCCFCLC